MGSPRLSKSSSWFLEVDGPASGEGIEADRLGLCGEILPKPSFPPILFAFQLSGDTTGVFHDGLGEGGPLSTIFAVLRFRSRSISRIFPFDDLKSRLLCPINSEFLPLPKDLMLAEDFRTPGSILKLPILRGVPASSGTCRFSFEPPER